MRCGTEMDVTGGNLRAQRGVAPDGCPRLVWFRDGDNW